MNLITLKDFSYFLDSKRSLFLEQTLVINDGEKIGLVGNNGSGKSTLLNILAGNLQIDQGEFIKSGSLAITLLKQSFGDVEFVEILQTAKDYFKNPINQKYFADFGVGDLHKDNFSGGEIRKIALVVAILEDGDVLLLDEPTNHLDLESLQVLEKILKQTNKTLLIISHDRYFLDSVCNSVVEIEHGKIFKYKGGYTDFVNSKNTRINTMLEANRRRDEFLKRELEWVNAGVKARETKNKGRLNRYYQVLETPEYQIYRDPFIKLPKITPFGNKILKTIGLTKAYKKPIIQNLEIEIEEGMKIGVVGSNGVGKSTLLNLLMGKIKPDTGKVILGKNTEFNYIDQMRSFGSSNKTVFDYITQGARDMDFGGQKINAYGYLKNYLFSSDMLDASVKNLSGGQKARLMLANAFAKGGNFLVLDEPTNDLDMQMINILETALIKFSGCLFVISHDRYFLDRLCSHILFLPGDGKYVFSSGGWTDFESKYNSIAEKSSVKKPVKLNKNDPYGKFLLQKQKQQDQTNNEIELEIIKLEKQKTTLETDLCQPDLFLKNRARYQAISDKLDVINTELLQLYTAWK
jgi:ABC transport system ATP-binding/permease protein